MGERKDLYSVGELSNIHATNEDKNALTAALQVGVFLGGNEALTGENFEKKYGITTAQWEDSFGTFTPEDVIPLCVMENKPIPQNPRQWKKFAKFVKKTRESVFGKN